MTTKLEVTFNTKSKKFTMVGPDALDHLNNSKKLTLNMPEIMQIIDLYENGTIYNMIKNNTLNKKVHVRRKHHAELFLLKDPEVSTPRINNERGDLRKSDSKEMMTGGND